MTISVVLLFPPSDSFKSLVNFESRYGTWLEFFEIELMTLPRVDRLELIFLASSRAAPLAQLLDTRSDPAKSTRFIKPFLKLSFEI